MDKENTLLVELQSAFYNRFKICLSPSYYFLLRESNNRESLRGIELNLKALKFEKGSCMHQIEQLRKKDIITHDDIVELYEEIVRELD